MEILVHDLPTNKKIMVDMEYVVAIKRLHLH